MILINIINIILKLYFYKITKFKKVLVPEINMGQLIKLIRSEYLVDAKGLNQVTGKPISGKRIIENVNKLIG